MNRQHELHTKASNDYKKAELRAGFLGLSGRQLIVTLLACVLLFTAFAIPSPYIVERPGGAVDILGNAVVAKREQPLLKVIHPQPDSADNTGKLRFLTVNMSGTKEHPRSWGSLIKPLLLKSEDIVPVEAIYRKNQSDTDLEKINEAMMQQAQAVAAAAAGRELGYSVTETVTISNIIADTPAVGHLQISDQILAVNGEYVISHAQITEAVRQSAGEAINFRIKRGEQTLELSLAPKNTADGYLLGILMESVYEGAPDVQYAIEKVGGPSAGMMFALAIIDKIKAEDLTGGKDISGTGAVDGLGNIGAIGGLKQKIYAAHKAGSKLMLMPASNCSDLPGDLPKDLQISPVKTLSEATQVIRDFRSEKPVPGVERCDIKE